MKIYTSCEPKNAAETSARKVDGHIWPMTKARKMMAGKLTPMQVRCLCGRFTMADVLADGTRVTIDGRIYPHG